MPPEFRYRAFGMNIGSDLELPELLPANAPPDVRVEAAAVPSALEGTQLRGARYAARPDEYLLSVDGIARFLARGGSQILYEAAPEAPANALRLFLLGRPLGALLHQRGVVPLHAGAVRVGAGCIAFSGPSGVGKSTLVAAFRRRGHTLLSDELCAVVHGPDGLPLLAPGMPQIKLWRDALRQLGLDHAGLRPVRPKLHKYWLSCQREFERDPLPLRCLFVLRTTNRPEPQLATLSGTEKMQALLADTYGPRLVALPADRKRHFAACAALARQTRVVRVHRPRSGFDAERLADLLEREAGA